MSELTELVDVDVRVDLDALWRGMAARLRRRGFQGGELREIEGLFWSELAEGDDWLEIALDERLEFVGKLKEGFARRFVALAFRATGRAHVAAAPVRPKPQR